MNRPIAIGMALSINLGLPTYAADLFLKPTQVAPNVYAVIGDLGPQSLQNDGLNNNLGFVVTDAGVAVINSGPTTRVAQALHAAIKKVTNQPIKIVINGNSQPHYWLGNDYFRKLNIPIIAHQNARELMEQNGIEQLEAEKRLLKEKADRTRLAYPNQTFDERRELQLGDTTLILQHFGVAHTPGDIVVWLPQTRVAFAGDLVFTERLLAVLPNSSTAQWIAAFDKLAGLRPQTVVPGHGKPTDIARAQKDTRDYLAYLRAEAQKRLDQGESLQEAVINLDQSAYKALANFDILAKRNVNYVYLEVEQEFFK